MCACVCVGVCVRVRVLYSFVWPCFLLQRISHASRLSIPPPKLSHNKWPLISEITRAKPKYKKKGTKNAHFLYKAEEVTMLNYFLTCCCGQDSVSQNTQIDILSSFTRVCISVICIRFKTLFKINRICVNIWLHSHTNKISEWTV